MFNILILLVSCFQNTFSVKLVSTNEILLKNCVAHTIENIFEEDKSVLFISSVGGEYAFPDRIKNPYVIRNTDGLTYPNGIDKIFSNQENVVLHLVKKSDLLLISTIKKMFGRQQKNSYLYITPFNNLSEIKQIFELLWRSCVLNLVVIGYENNGNPTVFTSDQYALANKCGSKFEYYVISDCNSTIKHKFPKVLRKYPHCNLVDGRSDDINIPLNLIERFLLKTIADTLNMSLYKDTHTGSFGSSLYIYAYAAGTDLRTVTVTLPYYYDDLIWSIPPPRRISPLTVLKLVFKPLVWVFIMVAFIIMSLVWWLFSKFNMLYTTTFVDSIFKVYSMTLFAYVIYAIHIQTAFTSKLVQILTIPQYEPSIQNLKDLADSDLSILATNNMYKWISNVDTKHAVHKTIYILLTIVFFGPRTYLNTLKVVEMKRFSISSITLLVVSLDSFSRGYPHQICGLYLVELLLILLNRVLLKIESKVLRKTKRDTITMVLLLQTLM
ncbi:hypothetical protein FQR65_LT06821 [Abscondita terminalis]|nr:hypothetical protein FQR65_LT06821 [Abscondita terminalis]